MKKQMTEALSTFTQAVYQNYFIENKMAFYLRFMLLFFSYLLNRFRAAMLTLALVVVIWEHAEMVGHQHNYYV